MFTPFVFLYTLSTETWFAVIESKDIFGYFFFVSPMNSASLS